MSLFTSMFSASSTNGRDRAARASVTGLQDGISTSPVEDAATNAVARNVREENLQWFYYISERWALALRGLRRCAHSNESHRLDCKALRFRPSSTLIPLLL